MAQKLHVFMKEREKPVRGNPPMNKGSVGRGRASGTTDIRWVGFTTVINKREL